MIRSISMGKGFCNSSKSSTSATVSNDIRGAIARPWGTHEALDELNEAEPRNSPEGEASKASEAGALPKRPGRDSQWIQLDHKNFQLDNLYIAYDHNIS